MSRLEQKLIDCLRLRSFKQDFARLQKWDQAAEYRENERILARDFHNELNGASEDGYEWALYEKSVKDHCEQRFGTSDAKSILKMIDRQEKLKQLGI